MFGSESYPILGKRPKLVVSYCGGNNGGKLNNLGNPKIVEETLFSFYPNPKNTPDLSASTNLKIIDIDFQ